MFLKRVNGKCEVKCLDAEMRKKGFTLIELLVVIAIIALLLSILTSLVETSQEAGQSGCLQIESSPVGSGLENVC